MAKIALILHKRLSLQTISNIRCSIKCDWYWFWCFSILVIVLHLVTLRRYCIYKFIIVMVRMSSHIMWIVYYWMEIIMFDRMVYVVNMYKLFSRNWWSYTLFLRWVNSGVMYSMKLLFRMLLVMSRSLRMDRGHYFTCSMLLGLEIISKLLNSSWILLLYIADFFYFH